MAAKKPALKQKVKKKKWHPIYAPAVFGSQLIGESYVESSEQLKGKFINTNLSTITNDMKKQNLQVKLRVSKVVEGKGQTEVIGMQLVQGFVKRLVRRGRTKVEDSFTVKTKDGQMVRVKPLIITTSTCVASTASQLRMTVQQTLREHVSSTGFVNTIQDLLNFRIQKSLKESLNKIHPIRSVDIRAFVRETVRGQVPEAELEVIPEEEVKEEMAEAVAEATEEKAPVVESKEEPKEEATPAEETKEAAPEPVEDKKE